MAKQRSSTRWLYTLCACTTQSIHAHGMRASPMSSTAITELPTARLATAFFQVSLRFQPLCPIDVAIPFATTKVDLAHVQSEANKADIFIEQIQPSSKRSMTYWTEPMLSTRYQTSPRWATKFGYICRRSASLVRTTSFTHSNMANTPSPRQ